MQVSISAFYMESKRQKKTFLGTAQKTCADANWPELGNLVSSSCELGEENKFLAFPAFVGEGKKKKVRNYREHVQPAYSIIDFTFRAQFLLNFCLTETFSFAFRQTCTRVFTDCWQ